MKKGDKTKKKDYERGKISTITLKNPFNFNGNKITEAKIEIDHINFGLNKKTLKLNIKRRSNFTTADIEKFLLLLDDEYILPKNFKGINRFQMRIDSPIPHKFYRRQFILIFETDTRNAHLIHTITLFPGW